MFASEIIRFELLGGARERGAEAVEDLCSTLSWLPVDEPVAHLAGSLAAQYRKAYGGFDDVDYLIGATALVQGADLLTTNVRHFPRLPGLTAPY
jgi:predicted nucleic acid-binding protein